MARKEGRHGCPHSVGKNVLAVRLKFFYYDFNTALMKYMLLLMGALMMGFVGFAQDPTYTQFTANKLYLNPAFAGYDLGMTASLHYRSQWIPVGEKPAKFETNGFAISWEVGLPFLGGIGFIYNSHSEGTGLLSTKSYGLVYALRTKTCDKRFDGDLEFSFGFRGTYNERGMGSKNLIFSDQLHPVFGNIFGTNVPLADMFVPTNYVDLDAGVLIDYSIGNSYFRLGLAGNHILRRNISVANLNDYLGTRFTFHGTYILKEALLNEVGDFIALMKLDYQRNSYYPNRDSLPNAIKPGFWYKELDIGVAFQLHKAPYFTGGIFWHGTLTQIPETAIPKDFIGGNMNGLSIVLGYEFQMENDGTLTLTGSHQYDYSGLNSKSGGIWEISLIYNLPGASISKCGGPTTGGRKGPPCRRW